MHKEKQLTLKTDEKHTKFDYINNFSNIFFPPYIFDQIFGQVFDQGFGEGKNHKLNLQFCPALRKKISGKPYEASKDQTNMFLFEG